MVRIRYPNGSYAGFRIEQRGFGYLAVRARYVALLIYLCCVTLLHYPVA